MLIVRVFALLLFCRTR